MLSAGAGGKRMVGEGKPEGSFPSFPFSLPRLPGLLPSPVRGRERGSGLEGEDPSVGAGRGSGAHANARPLFFGRRRSGRSGDGPRAALRPFREEGVWRATGLGTTLGRACSRGCRERKVRSKIGWLAGSRDSHHVSRFAAFFILARAEISVDGSCFGVSFLAATLDAGLNRLRGGEGGGGRTSPASPFLFASPSPIPPSPPREGKEGRRVRGRGFSGRPPPSPRGRREAPTLRIGVARRLRPFSAAAKEQQGGEDEALGCLFRVVSMILPQVHLRKPCYDFSFL
jgi:hypothetical protein